jgi:hypothetical protein
MLGSQVEARLEAGQRGRQRRAKRANKLHALGFGSYRDYIASPHWKQIRARYRASDLPQECICGEQDVHLHHMTYERVGAERLTDLTPLCPRCHALIHELERRGETTLAFQGLFDEGRAYAGRALLAEMAHQAKVQRERRREEAQQALLASSPATRLLRVVNAAKRRHMNISQDLRLIKHITTRAKGDDRRSRHVLVRIAALEAKVYGWTDWHPHGQPK